MQDLDKDINNMKSLNTLFHKTNEDNWSNADGLDDLNGKIDALKQEIVGTQSTIDHYINQIKDREYTRSDNETKYYALQSKGRKRSRQEDKDMANYLKEYNFQNDQINADTYQLNKNKELLTKQQSDLATLQASRQTLIDELNKNTTGGGNQGGGNQGGGNVSPLKPSTKKSNTMLYVGIGGAILVLGLVGYFVFKKD
jgi:chromosome segregation ATPase